MLFDTEGEVRAGLKVTPEGEVGLVMFDPEGQPRAGMVVGAAEDGGDPSVSLWDANGAQRVRLEADSDPDLPNLTLLDGDDNLRTSVYVLPDGSGGMMVHDAQGDQVWKVP